jgi:hypothetical protein
MNWLALLVNSDAEYVYPNDEVSSANTEAEHDAEYWYMIAGEGPPR